MDECGRSIVTFDFVDEQSPFALAPSGNDDLCAQLGYTSRGRSANPASPSGNERTLVGKFSVGWFQTKLHELILKHASQVSESRFNRFSNVLMKKSRSAAGKLDTILRFVNCGCLGFVGKISNVTRESDALNRFGFRQ